MALRLAKETPQKVIADYWKITAITIYPALKKAEVTLSLFVSEAASREGAEPVANSIHSVNHDDFSNPGMDAESPVAIAYREIKAKEEFAESEDV